MGPRGMFSWITGGARPATPAFSGAKRPRGSAAASGGGGYDESWGMTDEQREIQEVTARLALSLEARSRAQDAQSFTNYIGDKSNAYCTAVEHTGKEYYNRVKGKPRHGEGPPHLWLAASLIQEAASAPDLSPVESATFDQIASEFAAPGALDDLIRVCRYSATFKKGTKITLGFTPTAYSIGLPQALDRLLGESGLTRKRGEAPRGPLARRLRELVGVPAAGGGGDMMSGADEY